VGATIPFPRRPVASLDVRSKSRQCSASRRSPRAGQPRVGVVHDRRTPAVLRPIASAGWCRARRCVHGDEAVVWAAAGGTRARRHQAGHAIHAPRVTCLHRPRCVAVSSRPLRKARDRGQGASGPGAARPPGGPGKRDGTHALATPGPPARPARRPGAGSDVPGGPKAKVRGPFEEWSGGVRRGFENVKQARRQTGRGYPGWCGE